MVLSHTVVGHVTVFSGRHTFRLLEVNGLTVSGGTSIPGGQGRAKVLFRYCPLMASSTTLTIQTNIHAHRILKLTWETDSVTDHMKHFSLSLTHTVGQKSI